MTVLCISWEPRAFLIVKPEGGNFTVFLEYPHMFLKAEKLSLELHKNFKEESLFPTVNALMTH